MVRLSKQKQEKLESIMNLVEELGIDRVLARLRQTKMMGKEVLDDMKEWETDYEKRVALLGFLVSPEGKRAFGALYELAKVHEEQIRLQEEQEKLRQEQLNGKHSVELKRSPGGAVSVDGKQTGVGNSSMKNKLRAQMNKRKSHGPQQNQPSSLGVGGKSKKISNKKVEEKEDPLLEEAARTLQEAQRQVQEKKRIDELRSHLATSEGSDTQSLGSARRSAGSPRATPKCEGNITSTDSTPRPAKANSENKESEKLIVTEAKAKTEETKESNSQQKEEIKRPISPDEKIIPKALNDFTKQQETEKKHNLNVEENVPEMLEEIVDFHKDNDVHVEVPRTGEWIDEAKNEIKSHTVEDTDDLIDKKATEKINEMKEVSSYSQNSKELSSPEGFTRMLDSSRVLNNLLAGLIEVRHLRSSDIDDLVSEWRYLRKERLKIKDEFEEKNNFIVQLRDELRKTDEEKDEIVREKDNYVLKEYDLQQKYQELTQRHRGLREEYESLKQGNYQIQQNNKKNNRLHQELKKKIAKLESKIKSMDKVTIRRGTQTEDTSDKDVHLALRMAEESLSVTQSDLASSYAKLKVAQQEAEEYKKQVNIKGREINKRERKSKKDEDAIRMITRERDVMEAKLKKISEQMEYYKNMAEIKGKGNSKKSTAEKKEVKVQRCASGRHLIVKTVSTNQNHEADADGDETARSQSRSNRAVNTKQGKVKQISSDKQNLPFKKSSVSSSPSIKTTTTSQSALEKSSKSNEAIKSEGLVKSTTTSSNAKSQILTQSSFSNDKQASSSVGKVGSPNKQPQIENINKQTNSNSDAVKTSKTITNKNK